MAGLLSNPDALDAQPGATPPPAADPNADPNAQPPADPSGEQDDASSVPDDQEGEPASPDEQAKYDAFVKAGYAKMYAGGKVNPDVLKMLDNDPADLIAVLGNASEFQKFGPIVALAATAAIITLEVCKQTGEKDGTIILHGGAAILEDLVEVAGKAGIKDYSEEEMGQAMHMGADLFRHAAQASGLVDLGQAKQDWSEITTADKEGKLTDVIPEFKGVEAVAQSVQQRAQAATDPNADPNAQGGGNGP